MAEMLAVAGGIASFTQVIDSVGKVVEVVINFCQDMKDAPSELRQIRDKLLLLRGSLDDFQQYLTDFDDDFLLPPDLRLLLNKSILSVHKNIRELQHICQKSNGTDIQPMRRRFKHRGTVSSACRSITAVFDVFENHCTSMSATTGYER